jgi:hypothetical protein
MAPDMENSNALRYILDHVFMPPLLPQKDDHTEENDVALVESVIDAATDYRSRLHSSQQQRWDPILKMLRAFRGTLNSPVFSVDDVQFSLKEMRPGGDSFASV